MVEVTVDGCVQVPAHFRRKYESRLLNYCTHCANGVRTLVYYRYIVCNKQIQRVVFGKSRLLLLR